MKRCFFAVIIVFILLTSGISEAVTAKEMAKNMKWDIDSVAMDLLESLGELTHLDAAFLTRISVLPQEKQKGLAAKLLLDGHMTVEKLKKVPIPIVLPASAEDVLVLIYERIREDYWRGWYRRHTFTVRLKMQDWRDSAERRFTNPEEAKMLIDVFFQMLDGQYKGPKVLSSK